MTRPAAPETPLHRLQAHWVYGGTLAALVLLALTPLLTAGWPLSQTLTWLTLPAYMLHQYEEHDADRFRLFVNSLTKGPALSIADVFWINIIGVWAVLAAIIGLTRTLDPGWGVTAAWFLIVNGAGHLAQAAVLRRANPGVWTGALIFLPLGAAILATQPATAPQQAIALAFVLALHAAILLRVRQNLLAAR
ncbi:MAG TPA: HXXEE domain-containing protein [Tabrizicola sp.]|nr:HXXEE domain-containing protein [Tabrizicola sp.]